MTRSSATTTATSPARACSSCDLQHWTAPAIFPWHRAGDTLWHEGETVSFRNVVVRTGDLTITILTNRDGEVPYKTAMALVNAFVSS